MSAAISVMGGDARALALEEVLAVFDEDVVAQAARVGVLPSHESPAHWQQRVRKAAIRALSIHPTPATGAENAEAVVIIGPAWQLLWASADTLKEIVERTGIKIGSKLYAHPPATPTPEQRAKVTDQKGHTADAVRDACLRTLGKVVSFDDSEAIAEQIVKHIATVAADQRARQEVDAEEVTRFEREERFIVIKRKHLHPMTEASLRHEMRDLGIHTVECVVVESDWPEYETVWQMIADRIAARKGGAE